MNGYNLSRAFCEFGFANPEKIKPTHYAIYFYAIDQANSLGWKDKFGLPTRVAMEAIGIKKIDTYTAHLKDLIEWGFIEMVQKSVNQNTSSIIRLLPAHPKKGSALGKARGRHEGQRGDSTRVSEGTVYKPINLETYKPLNLLNFQTEKFYRQYVRRESPLTLEHPPLVSTAVAATNVQTSNKSTKPKSHTKPKADPNATYHPHGGMNAAIQEFIRHREEIKKPMTPRAVDLMLNEFKGFTVKECMEAIKTSIVGGYQGVFPKKEAAANGTKPKDETSGPNIRKDIDYKKGSIQL